MREGSMTEGKYDMGQYDRGQRLSFEQLFTYGDNMFLLRNNPSKYIVI